MILEYIIGIITFFLVIEILFGSERSCKSIGLAIMWSVIIIIMYIEGLLVI